MLGVTGPGHAAKELLRAGLLEQFEEESAGFNPLDLPTGSRRFSNLPRVVVIQQDLNPLNV